MALSHVILNSDVYMVCINHAFSTEREEVMGLLIGEVEESRICNISAVVLLRRSDKKQDRVEISPEQLSDASTYAERLADSLGKPIRVLGWYHSHPKITVWPSHVDLQTQAMYQIMDECFFGIIFSVFNKSKSNKSQSIEMTCFQSVNQSPEGESPQFVRLEVPVYLKSVPYLSQECLDQLLELSRILHEEENEVYRTLSNSNELMSMHNKAVYTKALCKITEVIGTPLLQTLEVKLLQKMDQVSRLQKRKSDLLKKMNLDT